MSQAPDADDRLGQLRDHLLDALGPPRGLRAQVRAHAARWFIDSKQTVCRPEAMLLVAEAVLALVPDDATAIGGLTMGADPVAFVTAAVAATRAGRSRPSASARR